MKNIWILSLAVLLTCATLTPVEKARKAKQAGQIEKAEIWYNQAIESQKDSLGKVFYIKEKCSMYFRPESTNKLKECARLFKGLEQFSSVIVPWLEKVAHFLAEHESKEAGRDFLEMHYEIDEDYIEGILDRYIKRHFN